MYLDTAYIVKVYLNEPESAPIRKLVKEAGIAHSSGLALAEAQCVFHRQVRDGVISAAGRQLARLFLDHIDEGLWNLVPAADRLLRRAGAMVISAAPTVFLRTVDAVHLATAADLGESEIWTNDRHMLKAAPHFGLIGRTV